MSKEKIKTSESLIYNLVDLWTNVTDEDKIKHEVDRWTRNKYTPKKS